MSAITVIYGSTMGNTQSAAGSIASALSAHTVTKLDVSKASKEIFEGAEVLILGSSTWGLGDLQDDWESEIDTLRSSNLSGKKVALFGCGDADSYCDTFVDAIGILYEAVVEAGATVVGKTSTEGYGHSLSRAEVDGEFVGLALNDSDSDNDSKIASWCEAISVQL
ncbi:MAG: flavodoxin [Rikenellaceae bacterium]